MLNEVILSFVIISTAIKSAAAVFISITLERGLRACKMVEYHRYIHWGWRTEIIALYPYSNTYKADFDAMPIPETYLSIFEEGQSSDSAKGLFLRLPGVGLPRLPFRASSMPR